MLMTNARLLQIQFIALPRGRSLCISLAGSPLNGKIGQLPLTLFTVNAFIFLRFFNHFHRLKKSSHKESRTGLLLIEAARSGVRDPNL